MKSKLNTDYNVSDPAKWLEGGWQDLDPIFAGRLAYLAEASKVKMQITEGYRSPSRQAALYQQYLNYKKTGKGSVKLAAKPGTSWHEFRLAIDTSTQPMRRMDNAALKSYGLCKPIKSEGWHIQPIETAGQTDRLKWAPVPVPAVRHEDMQTLRSIGLSEGTLEYLLKFPYREALFLKIATGIRTKGAVGSDLEVLRWCGLSESTISYIVSEYKYGAELAAKLADAMRG